jgi:hypothetical protein
MKVGIFATQAMEMSAPNWDSFRVQGAPNHVFFKTKKKAWTGSFFPDDMASLKACYVLNNRFAPITSVERKCTFIKNRKYEKDFSPIFFHEELVGSVGIGVA